MPCALNCLEHSGLPVYGQGLPTDTASVYAHTCSDASICAHSDMETRAHRILSLCKRAQSSTRLQDHKRKQTTQSSGATPPVLPLPAPHCPLLAAWWPGQAGTTSVSAAPGWLSASSLLDLEARRCLRCSPKPALAPGEVSYEGSEARGQKN